MYEGLLTGEIDPELVDHDFEWHNASELPGASVHHGLEAARRELARQVESWEEIRFEPQEFIESGEDQLVVIVRIRAVGLGSGASLERDIAHLWRFRGDKATQVRTF